jgi:hypothetical protein
MALVLSRQVFKALFHNTWNRALRIMKPKPFKVMIFCFRVRSETLPKRVKCFWVEMNNARIIYSFWRGLAMLKKNIYGSLKK